MRWIISTLDVKAFDATQFNQLLDDVRAQGITILALSELRHMDTDWQRQLYELDWVLTLDEPQPDTPTKLPFEQYVKREIDAPGFLPDGWFVALDAGDYVGMAQLHKNEEDAEQLRMGFTGVIRGYRQRGVATALKVHTIAYAQRVGAKSIRTGNQENNPMYQLNLRLGFKKTTASLAFEKRL
jgi:GNAT superfamily N-acetyltransferase